MKWEGIGIYAKSGSDIKAVHHGRVVFADWFRGKGLLLIIDHGDGYMSLYAHSQTLLRETGDWVSAGETIATLTPTFLWSEFKYCDGSTQTGYHLRVRCEDCDPNGDITVYNTGFIADTSGNNHTYTVGND